MPNEYILNFVLPEYKPVSQAPRYWELLREHNFDAQAAFEAELPVRYKTINLALEVWIMANPDLSYLQHIINPTGAILRPLPVLKMTRSDVIKLSKKNSPKEQLGEKFWG